jgi:hypothetical protein
MTPFVFGFVRYSTAGHPVPQQPNSLVLKKPEFNAATVRISNAGFSVTACFFSRLCEKHGRHAKFYFTT